MKQGVVARIANAATIAELRRICRRYCTAGSGNRCETESRRDLCRDGSSTRRDWLVQVDHEEGLVLIARRLPDTRG